MNTDTLVRLVIGALWGGATGSYFGCVAWRLPRRIAIYKGRSMCPSCGKMVPFYRNIPVISFLIQRGQTACCRSRLARVYIVAELFTMLLGAAFAALFGLEVIAVATFVCLVVLPFISWMTADPHRAVGAARAPE